MFIVKVPGINGLGKTNGCEKAGNAIIEALQTIHSNERGIPIDVNLFDLEEIHLDNSNLEKSNELIYENSLDAFDLEEIHLDNSNLEKSNELIYKNSLDAFETKPKTIFLGGDHSISFSTTKAFLDYCKKEKKEPCLIVFDAHADCMTPMKEPTHEEWLRALIEHGFPTKNILLVGIRNLWKDETEFIKNNNIRIISINQLKENLADVCDGIMEFSNNKELYISIDIDFIDPAFAPGTGYQEPGGLSSREFIYLVQRINKIKNLKAVDIVEVNPEKDRDGLTVKLGAKILSEFV